MAGAREEGEREPAGAPPLRDLLRAVEPRDFSVGAALTAVVRGLRELRRTTGRATSLSGRASIERALDRAPRCGVAAADVAALKEAMRDAARGGGAEAAARVEALVLALVPPLATGTVRVEVTGWPPDFAPALRPRLLRLPPETAQAAARAQKPGSPDGAEGRDAAPDACALDLDAKVVAALVREFDGFVLAGRPLRVRPVLPGDAVLPPVPRSLRARPQRRGRQRPWLPVTDEEGLASLTPRWLAERQARRMASLVAEAGCPLVWRGGRPIVVDGFCGLGGNAIALALAGWTVIAIERWSVRAAVARGNAGSLGVGAFVDVRVGSYADALPGLPPGAPLFLDPPWDALGAAGLPDWLPIPSDRSVMLKLPRDFDPSRLPGQGWRVAFEFGEGEDDQSVVRTLTIARPGDST